MLILHKHHDLNIHEYPMKCLCKFLVRQGGCFVWFFFVLLTPILLNRTEIFGVEMNTLNLLNTATASHSHTSQFIDIYHFLFQHN